MAFNQSIAVRKPTLACVGYLKSLGDVKRGKDGSPYFTIPVEIANQGNYKGKPGMDIKYNLSFLPEFFAADFDPNKIGPDAYGDKHRGVKWAYDRNVVGPKGSCGALLQCIVGDQETFQQLGSTLDNMADLDAETIHGTLSDFFGNLGPVGFGYILRQPEKKTDQINPETGKPVYELSPYYEVDTFFRISEDTVKKLAVRAEKNKDARTSDPTKEKFELRFDPADLGFEV